MMNSTTGMVECEHPTSTLKLRELSEHELDDDSMSCRTDQTTVCAGNLRRGTHFKFNVSDNGAAANNRGISYQVSRVIEDLMNSVPHADDRTHVARNLPDWFDGSSRRYFSATWTLASDGAPVPDSLASFPKKYESQLVNDFRAAVEQANVQAVVEDAPEISNDPSSDIMETTESGDALEQGSAGTSDAVSGTRRDNTRLPVEGGRPLPRVASTGNLAERNGEADDSNQQN